MLIRTEARLGGLLADLGELLKNKKGELFKLNRQITLDTDHWITEDYETVSAYLEGYIKNHCPPDLSAKVKPKGRILLILSYNEPFILSIIPVLNALAVGNEVLLKPSRSALGFAELIWKDSGLAKKYGLKLEIISPKDHADIETYVKSVRAVYFFGSHKAAQDMAKVCGENYVEFYPEVEAADCKIFEAGPHAIEEDVSLTLKESFSHAGQTCQRIHGVFVDKRLYPDYVARLKRKFREFCESAELGRYLDRGYAAARAPMARQLMDDVERAAPDEIVNAGGLPLLVINPGLQSEFVKCAYFLPTLWVSSFDSREQLVKILNSRRFFLGLNIQSADGGFADYVIANTRFTRYTVNASHVDVRAQEGWGGAWPSGYSGYKSWISHFSDGYAVIR